MKDPGSETKLRMAAPEPAETAEALAHRVDRERRAVQLQREDHLSGSLAPFRVGSIPHLNGVPLTRGLEEQITYELPSRLAAMLREDELDAALVSVTEVLTSDSYDVLDGIAVASLGEVKSVFLAHRGPIEEAVEVHCDPGSLTSRHLVEVLLAERGVRPVFKPLPPDAPERWPDYFMLIGDRALDFLLGPHEHQIWDLGAAWFELTRLPFVYAVWALTRKRDTTGLRRHLREARRFGLETLDYVIQNYRTDYPLSFRRDYLAWHIHYHLGSDEKRGLARFKGFLRAHGHERLYEPRFVL
jgi:chorismate dehydratase